MGVHAARLLDLPAIRRLECDERASVVAPTSAVGQRSASTLALVSSWRSVRKRTQTLVILDRGTLFGFVQAIARPGCESWDIVRLACLPTDEEIWARACGTLLNHVGGAAAQSGALRTFARVASEGAGLGLLAESSFRPYATEVTYRGALRSVFGADAPPVGNVRARRPRDAWDIFSLYCAVTPALIRHAEGRSLKEWAVGHRFTRDTVRLGSGVREAILGDTGSIAGWIRWSPARASGYQVLEALLRPEASMQMPELLRFAVDSLGLNADCVTLCRVREYDSSVSAPLVRAGFTPLLRETLLVRHTVARITERQLLVAALRAQGLGIDISHFQDVTETVPFRLAASREVERQNYDQFDQSARASGY